MLSADDGELDGWIVSVRPVVPSGFADRVLTRIAAADALERAARQRWIPRAAAAVAALIVIAGIAIVIIARPAGSRTQSRDVDERAPWNGSVAAASAAGPPADRAERVRDLVDALQAGDVNGAVAKLRVPLVHRTCSKQHVAATPVAAREVASCLAGLALIKHGSHRDVRRSSVEDMVRDARAASAASEPSRATDDLRALEPAYEVFAVKLSTRREPYHGEGYDAGVMYVAVDRAGSIGAIVLGPIMVAD